MTEFYAVKLGKTVHYSGYVSIDELLTQMRRQAERQQYDYIENDHQEIIEANSKRIRFVADLSRYLNDNVALRVKIVMNAKNLKPVTIETEERKIKTNDGNVELAFESWVVTDLEGKFTNQPFRFFIGYMMQKFFYGRQLLQYKRMAEDDMNAIIKELKAYLNLYGRK